MLQALSAYKPASMKINNTIELLVTCNFFAEYHSIKRCYLLNLGKNKHSESDFESATPGSVFYFLSAKPLNDLRTLID